MKIYKEVTLQKIVRNLRTKGDQTRNKDSQFDYRDPT